MSKNYTVIADLDKKLDIEDDNLIIVEDSQDTKYTTIKELKKCLVGDYKNSSDTNFYSSKKIDEMIDNINKELSNCASSDDLNSINKRVANIIAESGNGKDSEIIDARDGEVSLHTRLERDKKEISNNYIKKPYKSVETNNIFVEGTGNIELYFKNQESIKTIQVNSRNILNTNETNTNNITYTDTGFSCFILDGQIIIPFNLLELADVGKYYISSKIKQSNINESHQQRIRISNGSTVVNTFDYVVGSILEFEASKPFNKVEFILRSPNYNINVELEELMLTKEKSLEYIPNHEVLLAIQKGQTIQLYNDNYTYKSSSEFVIKYIDNINMDNIINDINTLKDNAINNRDKCGLIENYGEYLFFDNAICETTSSCILSNDNNFSRNGHSSLKTTFKEGATVNPTFSLKINDTINIESVSLVFYIDRTTSYYFSTETPIKISLCSDNYSEPDMVNYISVNIRKNELVQGWNIIKRNITNISEYKIFGMPNFDSFKYVRVEITRDNELENKFLYLNSVIFNQRMKPTVLLAFDGIYEEGIEYTYPYLTSRNFPATIFSNNRTTFTRNVLEEVVTLRTKYGWDLGQYGCNPNKELLTNDDNSREQYLSLKNTKDWLRDNLIYNPISYSAPFGNLRPITVTLLKDFGYKIAKTESTGYCNFFDPNYDFAIPMVLFSNETTEKEITDKIQYAIDNGCCICIYTNNVTNYGDESSSKKILFENIIKFIRDNNGKITPMTFSEFYNKCKS